jgi:hypothetical protein
MSELSFKRGLLVGALIGALLYVLAEDSAGTAGEAGRRLPMNAAERGETL